MRALAVAMEAVTYFTLYLLLFYVDDTNLAVEELEPGSRLVDGKVVVVKEEVEGDKVIPGDLRTARVIQTIANSICETIQMTVDCPSNYESGWMPLLDLQVRVASDNTLDYKFFSKKVSNPILLMKSSALPDKVKRDSLVQQAMTRLRNTRRTLPWQVAADTLTEFALRLKWSGYNARYRAEVLQAAVRGYEKLLEAVDRGERPLHRPREWEAQARRQKKLIAKAAWYRPAHTVTFVPATPGGELTCLLREVLQEEGQRLGLNIRAVEQGGTSLKRKLTGGDLKGGELCGQPDCLLCKSGVKGGCHRRAGVVYKGTCNICENANIVAAYYGESAFSGYYRTNVHAKEIEKRDLENAFAKHLNIYHPEKEGDPSVFTIRVIQTFRKPMPRQTTEAVFIHNSDADILMNSKAEFKQPAIPRVTTTREPPGGEGGGGQGGTGRGGSRERGGSRGRGGRASGRGTRLQG